MVKLIGQFLFFRDETSNLKSTVLKGLTGTNLLEPVATGNSITAILQYFTHRDCPQHRNDNIISEWGTVASMYVSTYVCVCVCVLLGMSVIDRCLTVARSDVACKVFARSSPSLHLRCLLGMV